MLCLWFIHLELPGYIKHLALLLGTPDLVIISKDLCVLLLSLYIYKHIQMKSDACNLYHSAHSCHTRHLFLVIRMYIQVHVQYTKH
jgi:hypothetical protein